MKKILTLFAITPLVAFSLRAGDIVISQGVTPGDISQTLFGSSDLTQVVYADVGFTTGATGYSNVDITADLQGYTSGSASVTAYLSTSVGTGAGPALASNDVTFSSGNFSNILLFSGLTLDPGTSYFLTLAPDAGSTIAWGIDDSQPAPVTDLGVSIIPAGFCSGDGGDCASPPPSSPGFTLNNGVPADALGANPIFSVTANNVSGVPEPATYLLFATGLGALAFFRGRA